MRDNGHVPIKEILVLFYVFLITERRINQSTIIQGYFVKIMI